MSGTVSQAIGQPDLRMETSLEDHLLWLASNNLARFLPFFKRIRDSHVSEATRACVRHLAEHGLDAPGRSMRIWLLANSSYLDLLLDPGFVGEKEAVQVASIMRDASCHFSRDLQLHITRCESECDRDRFDRAIRLADAFIDFATLIPWLRNLTQHSDQLIRSKAAKVLCTMRPNPRMIERQMKSTDPRVRANAVEALWSSRDSEAIELLKTALNDDSHRVVVNALVGLHNLKVSGAYEKLLALTQDSSEAMCCAAVWGLGFIGDSRAIPTLTNLLQSSSSLVSQKARSILDKLSPNSDQAGKSEIPAPLLASSNDFPVSPLSQGNESEADSTRNETPRPESLEPEACQSRGNGTEMQQRQPRSTKILGI